MNLKSTESIEECLELLVGLKTCDYKFEIEKSDMTILCSIGRQVFKGTALTDRQFDLLKSKFEFYTSQFDSAGIEVNYNLRQPLRHIDRRQFIKIISSDNIDESNISYSEFQNSREWIHLRFPFSKKNIMILNEIIKHNNQYIHNKGTHEHFFALNEKYVFEIVDKFKQKSFEIEDRLMQLYEEIKTMKENPQNYVPGIYGFKLKNLEENAIDYMINDIGEEPNPENLYLYADRRNDYGLHHFDKQDLLESMKDLTELSRKLLFRTERQVLINNQKYNFNRVIESLLELNRFPTLFVLSEKTCYDELSTIHNALTNIFYPEDMTVLFRLDNKTEDDKQFNQYIKEKNLNSPLDKSTKVVYISDTELKKTIFKTGWHPRTVVLLGSKRIDQKFATYLNEIDLVIHYDDNASLFSRVEKI